MARVYEINMMMQYPLIESKWIEMVEIYDGWGDDGNFTVVCIIINYR